jgi:perosamine synthetase
MSTRSEPGAPPTMGTIPLAVPEIRGNEWAYLKQCLDDSWVSSAGPFVDRFEQMTASYVGGRNAVACVNGTAALHLALLVAGVGQDDEVVMPALTFGAPAHATRYVGAWPTFIDPEPQYWQLDANRVADFLQNQCRPDVDGLRNKATGRLVKAILPVHLLGHPCDMDPLLKLADTHGLAVIEDAAESLGALYKGRRAGGLAPLGCLSFNGNKIITCGGGGMLLAADPTLADHARYLSTQAKDDPVEYVHEELGYNYRLTNLQAAMGVAQFEMLDEYVARKRTIAARYAAALVDCPGISLMAEAPWATSIFWMYTILVDEQKYGKSSRTLMHNLAAAGIQSRPLWQPLNRNRSMAGAFACLDGVADALHRDALSLPCSVGLTQSDQDRVIDCLLRS